MRRQLAWVLLCLVLFCLSCRRERDPLPGFPRLVLWAWERPENLSFIIPGATGVAYLAETVTIGGNGWTYRPRMQPLFVPRGTPLIAVVRVETEASETQAGSAAKSNSTLNEIASELAGMTRRSQTRILQIDFDARASEREFYRGLLAAVRRRCGKDITLEMTALVSWCESDDWIRGLPVVDAVPMFFRMGINPHSTTEHLRDPLCRSSVGISTDEFYVTPARGRRLYVFSRRPWTESNYRAVLRESKKWL